MGNFYTNHTVVGPSDEEVLRFLRESQMTAYVAPTTQRSRTVVYEIDSDEQDLERIDAVAELISRHFACPVLGVLNHDDDVLVLRLYESGRLTFAYDSTDFLSPSPLALCRAFGSIAMLPFVFATLQRPKFSFFFIEIHRHSALARCLALPWWSVGSGFTCLSRGESPNGLQLEELMHTRRTST